MICSKYSRVRLVSADSVLLQEANFGILSFQPSGQRDANASHLVMEMLEQKRHRHCEYLKMLGKMLGHIIAASANVLRVVCAGQLHHGHCNLLDEMAPTTPISELEASRADLFQHHCLIYAAARLFQLQTGDLEHSRKGKELFHAAAEALRLDARHTDEQGYENESWPRRRRLATDWDRM